MLLLQLYDFTSEYSVSIVDLDEEFHDKSINNNESSAVYVDQSTMIKFFLRTGTKFFN